MNKTLLGIFVLVFAVVPVMTVVAQAPVTGVADPEIVVYQS
jgi:hypothetical protein